MPIVTVTVQGISPLLQHAFGAEFESEDVARIQVLQRGTPREQAEAVVYRDAADGTCYFPGAAIARLVREAGSNHKLKGSRRAVKFVVPSRGPRHRGPHKYPRQGRRPEGEGLRGRQPARDHPFDEGPHYAAPPAL